MGVYRLRLRAADVDVPVEFGAVAGDPGWNELGTVGLPAGPVDVAVSDETSGQAVFADAIRWRPSTRD